MTVPGRVVALAVAVALALAALTDRAGLLVRPWFTPVLLATAVLVGLVGVRHRGRVPVTTAVVLLLPAVVGAILTPALAGQVSHGSADTAALASRLGDSANPLLSGEGGHVTLLQILLAERQVGGVVLAGRSVTVEAIAAGAHQLQRSVIVCCAADAQSVSLAESGPPLPRTGTWVRVTGKLQTDGDRTVLAADAVTTIATPDNPFL